MCDQDHSKDDLEQYEARGLVTRKQFGAMLGAGIAMMLPKVANAVTVTESDVNVKTPDGTADCYFVHPATAVMLFLIITFRKMDLNVSASLISRKIRGCSV